MAHSLYLSHPRHMLPAVKRHEASPRRFHFHFLAAPKLVRTFLASRESVSLSSPTPDTAAAATAAAVLFLLFFATPPALLAVAEVGVGAPDPPSLSLTLVANDVDNGVGACEAGVECDEGVVASYKTSLAHTFPINRASKHTHHIGVIRD